MPRTEDAAGECDSSNATLCENCSKALQKPLVCARCKTAAYCSKEPCTAQKSYSNLTFKPPKPPPVSRSPQFCFQKF